MTLRAALAQLRASDHEAALRSLLESWRETRSVRVADVIDRVQVTREPIRGASVKARTEAWMAIAAKQDPADVGRLLATPWPGTWKNAMPVLEALTAFPSDPRIAFALAELVERAPYDTWTSSTFYRRLLAYVTEARDLRTLPTLRADLDREKSTYWRQGTRPIVVSAVTKLEQVVASPDDALVDELEAFFATERTRDRANAKSEAELLEAIYAAPDDDTPRAVFADWLTERGDPRGELITLQLASQPTEKMRKREASLLKKHEKAWVGDLATGLAKRGRVFERGFLARAVLDTEGQPTEPPKVFSDPAWATVWSVRFAFSIERHGLGPALLALPSMRWLKHVAGVSLDSALALARGAPRPRLETLEVETGIVPRRTDSFRAKLEEVAATRALSGLVELAVLGEAPDALVLLDGPLGKQLERFRLIGPDVPLLEITRWVEAHELPLREIHITDTRQRDTWALSLIARRDERGRFTRVKATTDVLTRWEATAEERAGFTIDSSEAL